MAGKLMGTLQADLATRVYRITSGFNDALYLVANEPSLGMYRIQEHIQTTIPKIVERKQALLQVNTPHFYYYSQHSGAFMPHIRCVKKLKVHAMI